MQSRTPTSRRLLLISRERESARASSARHVSSCAQGTRQGAHKESHSALPVGAAGGELGTAQCPAPGSITLSIRDTLEQVLRVSHRASAQAPSGEFLPPPALTSWLLRRTLLFTFVRLTSHIRLGRAENRRRMWVLLLPKQVPALFPVGHRDPKSLLQVLPKAEHALTPGTPHYLENTQPKLPVTGKGTRPASEEVNASHHR